MAKEKRQKKKKWRRFSVQDLIGAKNFTRYGVLTAWGEVVMYQVAPTNISVLSPANIEAKIHSLAVLISTVPNLGIICSDSSECFDANKSYLQARLETETNPCVRILLQKDIEFLDGIQVEMATARQFFFVARFKNLKASQVFSESTQIEKSIAAQGFEVRRMRKPDIKRFLALYFDAYMNGELMPDYDGEPYLEVNDHEEPPAD